MATKRSSTRSRSSKTAPKQTASQIKANRQMWAIILFAVGIFCGAVSLVKGENLWALFHDLLMGTFGIGGFMIAPIFIYVAVIATLDKPIGAIKHKIWQTLCLIALLCSAMQIFGSGFPESDGAIDLLVQLFLQGTSLKGGGLIGAIVGVPLTAFFPPFGASITIVLLIFVFVMLITGGTLVGLFTTAYRPVKQLEQAYAEQVERKATMPQTPNAEIARAGAAKNNKFNIDVPIVPVAANDGKKNEADILADAITESGTDGVDIPLDKTPVPKRPTRVIDIPLDDLPPFPLPIPQPIEPPIMRAPTIDIQIDDVPIVSKPLEYVVPPKRTEKPVTTIPDAEQKLDDIDNLVNKIISESLTEEAEKSLPEQQSAPLTAPPPSTADKLPAETLLCENILNEYTFPPISLLNEPPVQSGSDVSEELKANAALLVDTLKSFGVHTRVIDIARGPTVTRYELQPSVGVKISKITGLADDIALNLASAGVRIEAPIPNKAAVGIEVPNKVTSTVSIREMIDSKEFSGASSKLTIALGRDIAGNVTVADAAKMPHMLIAGSTGSGKSVCINSIIISLIYKSSPDEVKFLMIDPKVVELGIYNGIPHLLVPVVTDPRKAAGALGWAVQEMLKRYKTFADNAVRDLAGYNRLAKSSEELEPIPQMVIIIDELADLMMAAPNEVEESICRLAQMARAAGMHLIIATQRPSVDVITGVIKANIPSRIAFAVSSQVDSRTIIDMGGAEKLLGRGDMLFSPVGAAKPIRIQGCFVTDKEVEEVVSFVKEAQTIDYDMTIVEDIEKHAIAEKGTPSSSSNAGGGFSDDDEMMPAAIECVVETGSASTSLLQRRLKLGYARAARIVDEMEARGIVGPFEGSKPRQVLISKERWIEMKLNKEL